MACTHKRIRCTNCKFFCIDCGAEILPPVVEDEHKEPTEPAKAEESKNGKKGGRKSK